MAPRDDLPTYTLLDADAGAQKPLTGGPPRGPASLPQKPAARRLCSAQRAVILSMTVALLALVAVFSPLVGGVLFKALPAEIALQAGAQPEGITAGPGDVLYVGRVNTGGVSAVDVVTGNVTIVVNDSVAGPERRSATGLWYHKPYLFVGGGGPGWGGPVEQPRMYVFDAESGKEVLACDVAPSGKGFANDVTVYGDSVYVTNSFGDQVVAFGMGGIKEGKCVARNISLGYEFDEMSPRRPNGIAGSEKFGGLFVADMGMGSVWFIDGKTEKVSEVIGEYKVPTVDGIVVDGSKLYAMQKETEVVSIWELKKAGGKLSAEKTGNQTHDNFSKPTSGAIKKGRFYVANNGAKTKKEKVETFVIASFRV